MRSSKSPIDYIDLTISDNEDATPCHSPTEGYPWRPITSTDSINKNLPEHGVPLMGTYRKFNSKQLSRPNISPKHTLRAPHSQSLHAAWNALRLLKSTRENPKRTHAAGYVTSDAKRRRTGPYELSSGLETDQKKEPIEIRESPPRVLADIPVATNLSQPEQMMANDTVNESLKVALREQVFPHINQRLSAYHLSIDSTDRKQIGKKAAWEICREKGFMKDLLENNGQLSLEFEDRISGLAQSLVDRHVEEYWPSLNKSNAYHGPIMAQIPDGEVSGESSNRTGSKAPRQIELDEEAKAVRKAKLSANMKDRWQRGLMKRVGLKGSTRVTREGKPYKKPTRKCGSHTSKDWRQPTPNPRTTRSIFSVPPSSSDDEDVDHPRSSIFSSPASKMLDRPNPLPGMSSSHSTLKECQTLSDRDLTTSSMARPLGGQAGQDTPGALPNSKLPTVGLITMPQIQKPKISALSTKSYSAAYQIEKLQIAGHDKTAKRPYLSWQDQRDIQRGLAIMQSGHGSNSMLSDEEMFSLCGSIAHIDFCEEEIDYITQVAESLVNEDCSPETVNSETRLECIIRGREEIIPQILLSVSKEALSHETLGSSLVRCRQESAVEAFLRDAAAGLLVGSRMTRIGLGSLPTKGFSPPEDSITSILRQREALGRRRDTGRGVPFETRLMNRLEDDFVREAEWADCSGDIATITWLDDENFFCGATAHSDEHNMQYNKPGNLLVGSTSQKTLSSVSGHQVVRPIVSRGENSLASMRGTQDPWMYCSVTSTTYCPTHKKCFTGSYDQTVRVWDVAEDGSSLILCGTWNHSGNVNFVVASPHHGLVATAADVCEDAIRVYHFDASDVSASRYNIYEAAVQRRNSNNTWAYFPATMQWGLSPTVTHLLLVGYSPRSFNCYDMEIPDDRANTGELCLWDTRDGSRIYVTAARAQNVFEVVWHPSQPIFVVATSPAGTFSEWVNTQLRLFVQTPGGSFSHIKSLDCPALDINEITIMPNSTLQCYVTASCTDGNTYVWDSAIDDKPVHTLCHGGSIDDQSEEADSGVKFAAWGKSPHRFYTGSSDGVIKAWNVRASPGQAFVRDVITMSGSISAGKFSPDFSKLVVGDSTGKVHYLSHSDFSEAIRAPIKPHRPLPAPLIDSDDQEIEPEQSTKECADRFLERQQLVIHPDEYIGAIQGPNYKTTGLIYDAEKYEHESDDLKGWSPQELKEKRQKRYDIEEIRFSQLPKMSSSSQLSHEKNLRLDLNFSSLSLETVTELTRDVQLEFRFQDENSFKFELGLSASLEDARDCSFKKEDSCLRKDEIKELENLTRQITNELCIHKSLEELLL